MLIVIIIIGILAATLIPRIWNARDRANDVARVADIKSIATAMIAYELDNATFNGVTLSNTTLTNEKYGLGWQMPKDPVSGGLYDLKLLNNDAHFALCATLSSWSSNGNTNKNLASGSNAATDFANAMSNLNGSGRYYCYIG